MAFILDLFKPKPRAQARLTGGPSVTYQFKTGPLVAGEENAILGQPDIVQIVPPTDNEVAGGVTREFEVSGSFRLVEVHLDIPRSMDATLFLDNVAVWRCTDGEGGAGPLVYGDTAAGVTKAVQNARLAVTNDGSALRNVRAWMVVTP